MWWHKECCSNIRRKLAAVETRINNNFRLNLSNKNYSLSIGYCTLSVQCTRKVLWLHCGACQAIRHQNQIIFTTIPSFIPESHLPFVLLLPPWHRNLQKNRNKLSLRNRLVPNSSIHSPFTHTPKHNSQSIHLYKLLLIPLPPLPPSISSLVLLNYTCQSSISRHRKLYSSSAFLR